MNAHEYHIDSGTLCMENKVPMIDTACVVAGAILTFNYRCLGTGEAWLCPRGQGIRSVHVCTDVHLLQRIR